MNALSIMKETQIFQYLTDGQLKQLEPLAVEEKHNAGTVLYKEGDTAGKCYIVVEGKVVLEMKIDMGPSAPPLQVAVDFITGGEEMSWSAFVEPHIFTVSALCMDDTKLLTFESKKLRDLINQDAVLGFNVMRGAAKLVARRLSHTRNILAGERGLRFLPQY
jgi:hypothetical protein